MLFLLKNWKVISLVLLGVFLYGSGYYQGREGMILAQQETERELREAADKVASEYELYKSSVEKKKEATRRSLEDEFKNPVYTNCVVGNEFLRLYEGRGDNTR